MRWQVPLTDTTLGDEEAQAAAEVVRGGWLTQGPRVEAFERAFEDLVGVAHAVAVANCTLGLELAYELVGVGTGDQVLLPSLTFVATANAARRRSAEPVFVDITSEDDLTLDPADIARKLSARTRAVVAVHYGGMPCAMDPLAAALASGPGPAPALVEDCAHAPGARLGGRGCGSFGAVGAFSFFSNKNMTTGEGGMLTTQDPALAARAKALRSHGMTTVTWDRHRGHAFTYDVEVPGTNARMDEVRAAVGLVQLGRLPGANAARARVAGWYLQALDARASALGGLTVPHRAPRGESAWHLFVVLLPPGADRPRVMAELRERGVQTSIHYPPTHRFAAYQGPALPRTDAVAPRLLTLPLGPAMTQDAVGLVVDALASALARG